MLKLGSNVSDQKWGQYKYKGKMSRCHISDPKSDIRSKYYYWHQDKIWYDEWPTIICPLLLLLYYLDQFVENVQNNDVQWEHHQRQDLPDPRSHNQQQPRQQRQQRWRVLTKKNQQLWHSVESNNTTKTKTSTKTSHTQPRTAGAATEMASYKA